MAIDITADTHINGVTETSLSCSSCHGSQDNAAPPLTTQGEADTSDIAVGAHQSHLHDGDIRQAVLCQECHEIPTTLSAPNHIDAPPAELSWGVLAVANGADPKWDRETVTCVDSYCHGVTLSGGTNKTPTWTVVDGSQAACGTCHGAPPPPPHPSDSDCSTCHPATVTESGIIDVPGGKHINGILEAIVGPCDSCHGAPPATGSHIFHFGTSAAAAAYGGTEGTKELQPIGNTYAFNCGSCHPLDLSRHRNGVVNAGGGDAEIDLSPEGAPPGSLRSRNAPGASYQPGEVTAVDDQGFVYTKEGTCSGVYCHSRRAVDAPGPIPEPGVDFTFGGYPISYPGYSVSISREYATPTWGGMASCTSCHGLPPRTFSPDVAAGVGDSHSFIDDSGYENLHGWAHGEEPFACATCHFDTIIAPGVRTRDANGWSVYGAVPIANRRNHVNGQPDVTFINSPVWLFDTPFDLTGGVYDPTIQSCVNVSCHLQQTSVAWGLPFRIDNTYECNSCHNK